MTKKERYRRVIEWFQQAMPVAETELHYENPFQLLVAVILSAQCTDKRINLVTPALFEAMPTPEVMAAASTDEILSYIKSVSYPNNKARNLHGMACALVENYGSQVPSDIDSLISLPGVGRKTANVILSVIFGRAAMAVDTHVFRLSERLGLTTNIPEELIGKAHHWLILHGRYVCKARRPDCLNCGLTSVCRHYNQTS